MIKTKDYNIEGSCRSLEKIVNGLDDGNVLVVLVVYVVYVVSVVSVVLSSSS